MVRQCALGGCGGLRRKGRRQNADGQIGRAATIFTLDGEGEVSLVAELQTRGFPSPEMVASGDGAAAVHLSADGPVLLEGSSANNGGSISALFRPDLV